MNDYPETQYIQLKDGRKIAYCEYGDPMGQPAFYFHGTPGSRHELFLNQKSAHQKGFRLIATDRPGFGRSDYQQDRTFLSWSEDVLEVADSLSLDAFGMIGTSGGGPHVLACALTMPDRLAFSAVVSSWAPVFSTDLAEEMAPLDQFFSRLASRSPFLFSLPFSWLSFSFRYLPTSLFIKSLDSSLCDADRQILSDPKIAAFFQDEVAEAFAQGMRGAVEESILLYLDWGFELQEITAPVLIIHGEEDKFAPFSFGKYLHENLPNSTFRGFPGQGHLFLITMFNEFLDLISSST